MAWIRYKPTYCIEFNTETTVAMQVLCLNVGLGEPRESNRSGTSYDMRRTLRRAKESRVVSKM